MAVKIGHASIDENGKAVGGSAGDQNAKELCTRKWYKGGWTAVLRPKKSSLAEKSAKACEAGCANAKIGYDQSQRNTLYTRAKAARFNLAKITAACECDCSSFMHVCAIAGGANLTYGSNGHTTRTMVDAFVASGDYEKLTESKYRTSDKHLKRGDILVKAGSHTVMVLENGSAVELTSESKTTTTASVKLDAAQKFSKAKAGTYKVKSSDGFLNLRSGAAVSKKLIEKMPNGTKVRCYGYYTGTWLYVVSESGKIGFCSRNCLVKQ